MKIVLSTQDYIQLKFKSQIDVHSYLGVHDSWAQMLVGFWASDHQQKQFAKIQIERKSDQERNMMILNITKIK